MEEGLLLVEVGLAGDLALGLLVVPLIDFVTVAASQKGEFLGTGVNSFGSGRTFKEGS